MEKFQKHPSFFEKASVVIFGLLWIAAVIKQLFYHGDLLLAIAILTGCMLTFAYLVFWPEAYEFREDSFAVVAQGRGERVVVPYDTIVDFTTVGTFLMFRKDFDNLEVVLRYRSPNRKRVNSISCHPKNVLGFINELQLRCPQVRREDT